MELEFYKTTEQLSDIAQIVFDLCEWQFPSTVIADLIAEEEFNEDQFQLF